MIRVKDDLGGFYFINEDSLQIKNGDFIFLVGEIFFPSWESVVVSLYIVGVSICRGRRKPSGDKGAAPPRAQSALPMPWRLAPRSLLVRSCMVHT